MYNQPVRDREAAARAIVIAARRDRRPAPRWLWIATLVLGAIGAVCVGALAIAWVQDRDTIPVRPLTMQRTQVIEHSSGLGLGLLIGAGLVIAIATVIAVRRRSHDAA